MNLLCPNCQKPLQVPEQYAGQQMKCPLCNGTFSVPAMPPMPPPPALDVFRLTPEQPLPPAVRDKTPPASDAARKEAVAAPPPPPPSPTGYERTTSLTLKPQVVVWVAPAALALVFVLLFFPWVRTYELSKRAWYSQVGWGTGFGSEWGIWGTFFILLLFPTLALAVALAILPRLNVKLPPQVEQLWPWRYVMLGGAILLLGLFLLVQLGVVGFGLEQVVLTAGNGPAPSKDAPEDLRDRLTRNATDREVARVTLYRTFWLDLVALMLLTALIGTGLDAWLQRRGPDRWPPRVDVMW